MLAAAAGAIIVVASQYTPLAACLVVAYWFCDRLDGPLARLQGAASPSGAWLDANIDELVDLGLHAAVACSAAQAGIPWSWHLFAGFAAGKYLLMYGLLVEPAATRTASTSASDPNEQRQSLLRTLYHFPANADVRIHLLAVAMLTNLVVLELLVVAVYYNLRWMARYALLAHRSWRELA
jgi:phosphatidylglycerophosphate synthase